MAYPEGRVGIGRDWIAGIEVWEEAITEEGRKHTTGIFGRARDQAYESRPLASQTVPSCRLCRIYCCACGIHVTRNEGQIVLAAHRTLAVLWGRGEPVGGD